MVLFMMQYQTINPKGKILNLNKLIKIVKNRLKIIVPASNSSVHNTIPNNGSKGKILNFILINS